MKRLLIPYFFIILLTVTSTYSLVFNETFSNVVAEVNASSLVSIDDDDIINSLNSLTDGVTFDRYYKIGRFNTSSGWDSLATYEISSFWNIGGNQLKVNVTGGKVVVLYYDLGNTHVLTNYTQWTIFGNVSVYDRSQFAITFYNNTDCVFCMGKCASGNLRFCAHEYYDSGVYYPVTPALNVQNLSTVKNSTEDIIPFPGNIEFNKITFHQGIGAVDRQQIYTNYFWFTYDVSTGNSMPECNFSVTTDDCYDPVYPETPILFSLNTSCYDFEGDTIYYAVTEGVYNFTERVDYNNMVCLPGDIFCTRFDDYTFSYNVPDYGCNVSDIEYYYPGSLYLGLFTKEDSDVVLDDIADDFNVYGLVLNGECSDKTYYYRFDEPAQHLWYKTSIYNLGNGDNFTIDFLDSGLNVVEKFKVVGTANVSLYEENINNGTLRLIKSSSDTFNPIGFNYYENANTSNLYSVVFTTEAGVYSSDDNPKQSTSVIEYVRINFTESTPDLVQSGFSYGGIQNEPDFSTSLGVSDNPSPVYNPRTYWYQIYVTDSVHLYEQYDVYDDSVTVEYCDYSIGSLQGNNYNESIDAGNILGLFKNILGDDISSFYTTMGVHDTADSLLWWIFLFLFIIVAITQWMYTHQFMIRVPLLISSAVFFVFTWMIDYTAHSLVGIIVFSFAIATPFAIEWFGGQQ